MPTIAMSQDRQTVLTTFETTPGTCQDLVDLLTDAYESFISKQPGFIAAGLHVNDAQTRIANYSQWEKREDFQAMLRTDEMRKRNRVINDLCRSFEPVMYDVAAVF
ncbi:MULTISPECIES: antibiotic biosynthesis monooxygenase family protein [Maritimibacter]|jgi:quinol monooxygenase YgiN|uniref:Antibiotic biosynthesis monooxygenase domain protein n=1 Tax=Maritimibacter alkaliphilus HTCC2654 TaxID=314271 RepID=A3VAU7_9RHOB|nr:MULTISPECIES: antibiotic biosynthesis monooxygenase family protein [Maritimibacter]EAQ15038.1 antibiotic biosynthesis monooxygenase domain protein [Maritimibacter alkaliphilus HTCC2654]MBL6426458.1 antibiotic biosynthesis monooxygenase [Maritimibacter sp.]TYP80737.1 antibiotic biosynthesis monooxygenase [Maritimibacter alkaliphilus HTCC2654]